MYEIYYTGISHHNEHNCISNYTDHVAIYTLEQYIHMYIAHKIYKIKEDGKKLTTTNLTINCRINTILPYNKRLILI